MDAHRGKEDDRSDQSREAILVSAIVSTYNSEAFVRECLEDLEAQSIAGVMEIIVVDAASEQDEWRSVREYQDRFRNVVYVRAPRRVNVYAAWNLALRIAHGRYLTPCSTNDRLRSDAYKIMATALGTNPDVGLVYGDSYLTEKPHETFASHTRCGAYNWPDYSYEDLLQYCRVGPHPMWRRSVHDVVGHFDEGYEAVGDYEFWLRMGERIKLLHIPEVTGLVWVDPNSVSMLGERPVREIAEIRERYQKRHLKRLGGRCGHSGERAVSLGWAESASRLPDDIAADCLKRSYAETKASALNRKADLAWFFDVNFVSLPWLVGNLLGLKRTVYAAVRDMAEGTGSDREKLGCFVQALAQRVANASWVGSDGTSGIASAQPDGLERALGLIAERIGVGTSTIPPMKDNFLIPSFMKRIEALAVDLFDTGEGQGEMNGDLATRIRRIVAVVAGEVLASYNLYSESLGRRADALFFADTLLSQEIHHAHGRPTGDRASFPLAPAGEHGA